MQIFEALFLLGLSSNDRENKEAIRAAWKKKIYDAHPDRNSSPNTLKLAQALNEAKDVLLGSSESEFDRLSREIREENLAKKRAAEQSKSAFEEFIYQQEEKEKERRRERYNKNRKKRAPESRVHRKIESYPEGKALIEEMKSFFQEHLIVHTTSQKIVFVCDILQHFIQSRERNVSDSEKRLFQRHANRIIQIFFPRALYSRFKNKRGFQYITLKDT